MEVAPTIGSDKRHRWLAEEFGLTTQEQLTCGCHIHVEVESDEEGVAVIDRVRPWLATLLALSANSPFWQTVDSGYSSYRSRVWARWPSAGPVEVFGSAERYHERVRAMLDTGVLLDEGMVYFDVRLSHRYPTVEFRAADVCLEADDTVLLAILVRGLVDTAAREWRAGDGAAPVGGSELRLASWRAARSGLSDRSSTRSQASLPRRRWWRTPCSSMCRTRCPTRVTSVRRGSGCPSCWAGATEPTASGA